MKYLLFTLLMCSTLGVTENKAVAYESCGEWGHAFPVQENGHYVWYQERTCTEYMIDWTTLPPTTIVLGSRKDRRGGYPPNVE